MKKIALISLGLATLIGSHAQAANVNIKQDMINACTTQVTDKKITDTASAQKMCTCTVNVQGKITNEQKWEIDSWVQSGNNIASLPLYNELTKKMQACSAGIALKK